MELTQQYRVGETSLLITELPAYGTDPVVVRELACLRRGAETDPVSRGWVALRALELADVLCRDSLRRGDVLALVDQSASGAELREFCFCAQLADM